MSKSLSPGVVAAVVVVILIIIAGIGWKVFGPQRSADNLPDSAKQAYMSGSQRAQEQAHMQMPGGAPAQAPAGK